MVEDRSQNTGQICIAIFLCGCARATLVRESKLNKGLQREGMSGDSSDTKKRNQLRKHVREWDRLQQSSREVIAAGIAKVRRGHEEAERRRQEEVDRKPRAEIERRHRDEKEPVA